MHHGISGFEADLNRAAMQTESGVGPGTYHHLLAEVGKQLHEPTVKALFEDVWSTRRFPSWSARPSLLMASWRYLSLEDAEHPLAAECLFNAEASHLDMRTRLALNDPRLKPLLRHNSVQTNALQRAIAWGLPALTLGLNSEDFDLVDLGCSSGFHLVADRLPLTWRVDQYTISSLDFPSPARRLGLEARPFNPKDQTQARWARACVWPDSRARIEAFEKALLTLRAWKGPAARPVIEEHHAGRDSSSTRLSAWQEERPVLVLESLLRQELDQPAAKRHEAELHQWLHEHPLRIRVTLEPAPKTMLGALALEAHLVRDGELQTFRLARMDYNPSRCVVDNRAVNRLRASWDAT